MGKKTTGRVPVSRRALLQRVNRRLAQDGEMLRAARGARAISEVGDFYVIDVRRNFLLHRSVDPEALGRELGVLAEWEHVEDRE
jgi:hypothetical protein